MLITYQDRDYRISGKGDVYLRINAAEQRIIDEVFLRELRIESARQAWRRASERGYGTRDNSIGHMHSVDARIKKLYDKYQTMLGE